MMKVIRTNLIESEHEGLFKANLNCFLCRIKPNDLMDVRFTKNDKLYSVLIIYKEKI
jgi:hypothetical protein